MFRVGFASVTLLQFHSSPFCFQVIDYDKTFCIEETGVFQHYSIDTSHCVRSLASRCAAAGPCDFTGVDLSTISAVPRVGHSNVAGEPSCTHLTGSQEEEGITPPDTPFRSPLDYGCDFATVTCSTPYTDLEKPRKLTVRDGSVKKQICLRAFDIDLNEKTDIPSSDVSKTPRISEDINKDSSPSSGIGSLSTPGSSCPEAHSRNQSERTGTSECPDQHHSNCACGMIGHLSSVNPHYQTTGHPSDSLNTSCYDNLETTRPLTSENNPGESSPRAPREQYQSTGSLYKETALLRGMNTI